MSRSEDALLKIHTETPLLFSPKLSDELNLEVFLKLENLQPSGSFKLRGCGFHCYKEKERGCQRFITASSGNSGLAVATAGRILSIPVSVFVPRTTTQVVVKNILQLGAHVKVHGEDVSEANERAQKEKEDAGCAYIHPYLHPEIWEGHSTIIDEIAEQLQRKTPGCIVLAVGGGGLFSGILKGMERHGWKNVPIMAMETEGADCLYKALKAGKVVDLDSISSIATGLGARSIIPELLRVLPEFNVHSRVVTDAQAVQSCIKFADDHRMLVEPACGAALSAVYCGLVNDLAPINGPVVVVVCGGCGTSLSLLQGWASQLGIPFPGPMSTV